MIHAALRCGRPKKRRLKPQAVRLGGRSNASMKTEAGLLARALGSAEGADNTAVSAMLVAIPSGWTPLSR